ncbi:GNAT family N-acetyltransferase [Dethiosulfatarculus sandiegensis]|uniref:GNAT family acetyltransferase n=1 Tax=Dethiosulfatarculus sandiegensis TaxID=1429043 RepID=A0A0D2K0Y5_9BACT|nr:N-acetyltransferase [Dethiosulfatarculus sandiegensis]KIX15375.1 GNAT family acetyltransferase [Dethiosulfatarculus sandiegensis]
MKIISANTLSRQDILKVHRQAFGGQKGSVISELVNDLLEDPTAEPCYSFAAVEQDTVVGHVLFTNVTISGAHEQVSAQILAPLAVLPQYQNKGVGTTLVPGALEVLKKHGVEMVFVLGHPGYYPRFGFAPAGVCGFDAPYPIPEEHAAAWMTQELKPGVIGTIKGKVLCADALHQPEHWRE